MNTEDKKKQLEKRKSEISGDILNKETELKKINKELEKLKKINYEHTEADLKHIQSEISLLIEKYNEIAKDNCIPMLSCLAILDQKPDYEPYDEEEEEIPEILAFDMHERVNNIEIFPKNIEQMFYDRGWFPSRFC